MKYRISGFHVNSSPLNSKYLIEKMCQISNLIILICNIQLIVQKVPERYLKGKDDGFMCK